MDFDPEGIAELRDEFDRQARAFEGAAAGSASAQDVSGSVTVSLRPDGSPTVAVAAGWRSHLGAAQLGGAVVEAFGALATERLTAWSTSVAEKDDADESAADAARPSVTPYDRSGMAKLTEALEAVDDPSEVADMLSELSSVLDEINTGMESAMKTIAGRAAIEHRASSPGRSATATVDGSGALLSVAFDEEWLSTQDAPAITLATNEAIAAALRASANSKPANPFVGTPLERLGGLLDDPQSITRLLMRKDPS